MAITRIKENGFIGIPRTLGHRFQEGETVYCYKEDFTGRIFLSTNPCSSGEMYCKATMAKGGVILTADAKKQFESNIISVTVAISYNEKHFYLTPFDE